MRKEILIEINMELKLLLNGNSNFIDSKIDFTSESLIIYTKDIIDLPNTYKGVNILQEKKDFILDYSDFESTFLKFTEYIVPFGMENIFEPLLPSGWKKDSIGNYFYEIGESKTLFTTHLDNYTDKFEKVNHVIEKKEGNTIIKTDGKTILGGDNKLGVCILCNMISKGIPGTYYFFIGEEPIGKSPGVFGSSNALKSNPEFFSKFKRAIAFDRKEMWSIVTRQMGQQCCSSDFAQSLIKELSKSGLSKYKEDPTGYYTDSAVFMDVIPECTNISVGGWGEHTKKEFIFLEYFMAVAHAAENISWESLPAIREIKGFSKPVFSNKKVEQEFLLVKSKLSALGLLCTNSSHFKVGIPMTFHYWHHDSDYVLVFNENGSIKLKDKDYSPEEIIDIISREHLVDIDPVRLGISLDKANKRIIIKGDPFNIEDYIADFYGANAPYLLPNQKNNGLWKDSMGKKVSQDEVIAWLEYEYEIG